MNKIARWTTLGLVAICALGPAAISPALALAQGAEDEYNLDLPGSGGDASTPSSGSGSTDTSDSSDSSGFPVLVVVLIAAAGVAVGIAVWRIRQPGDPDEQAPRPPGA